MPNRLCLIDLPGLSHDLLPHIPAGSSLSKFLSRHAPKTLTPSIPAVTCSVQATLTTGTHPSHHGIIANGLPTFRFPEDQALVDAANFADYRKQISFWEQSNQFLHEPRFWQREDGSSKFKTALLFFQNSMPGFAGNQKKAADIVLTPKPDHGPDGKLTSLLWSEPRDLVPQLFAKFGPFPLMNYWGPMANITSSQWIANAAAHVWQQQRPDLQLTYIPHLDYDLQRFGPSSPQAQKAVADVAAAIEPLVQAVLADNAHLIILSEYALADVNHSVAPNRLLLEAGLLKLRNTPDGSIIDYEKSRAFAMVDHQIAHIYTSDPESTAVTRELFVGQPLRILGRSEQQDLHFNHPRSGDLALLADQGVWFDYRWWTTPSAAPKFAGMVDIHRKPGYDPLELFWDRANNSTAQDAVLIKGSHGAPHNPRAIIAGPAVTTDLHATEVATAVMRLLGDGGPH